MSNEQIKNNADAHNEVAKLYDIRHPEIYNDYEQDRLNRLISKVIKKTSNKSPSVLDVGAGTGNLSIKFLNKGCKVTASDVSEKALKVLQKKASVNNKTVKAKIITDKNLPFENNTFDIVCTYSVLHHIPDYLFTIKEMARICKKSGIIYIDHEVNENRWKPNRYLNEYYKISNPNRLDYIKILIKTGDLFSRAFLKEVVNKLFINSRYAREGDIHQWHDDHIEWDKISKMLKQSGCIEIETKDYLLYNPKGGLTAFRKYEQKCNDMRYIIYRKN